MGGTKCGQSFKNRNLQRILNNQRKFADIFVAGLKTKPSIYDIQIVD